MTIRRVAHCSHWGAYTLLVEDDRIVGFEPFEHDPAPSPILESVAHWATSERRVLQPLVREGWLRRREASDGAARGSDRFVPVGWDEVLEMVASEITRVSADHGNASIFAGSYGWTSCGRFHHAATLLKRMLNLSGGFTGHTDTYSIAAGPVILKHVLGNDDACSGKATTFDGIAKHTQTLLVFGSLSPRTAQCEAGGLGRHGLDESLREIRDSGCRVILVSPRRDDIPDWVEAEWWPIRPNTDAALMIGLAGEVVKAGRQDTEFLRRYTSGADKFVEYLSGDLDGVRKDAEWAADIVDLPATDIRALAAQILDSRTMIMASWSLQRAHHGEQPYWAALGLAAVLGQIGLPGGGAGFGYGSLGGVGAAFGVAKSPGMSAGRAAIDSYIPVARISDMLLHPGTTFTYRGAAREYPEARLVYWAGGNPFHHHQDLNRLREGWTRPQTIIVQDPMMTATAQLADIVLPASTSLERNDIAGNKRTDFIFAMHKAISPRGQARSDFDIFNELSSRLGTAQGFNEGRDEMGWIRHLYETSRRDAAERFQFELPEFDVFWERGHAAMPVRTNNILLEEFRGDPERFPLATESGRIVLGSDGLSRLGLGDCLPHPAWLEPAEWLGSAPSAGLLHLLSPQPRGRLHSQLEDVGASLADKRGGREPAEISQADAGRLGIASGDCVRLGNSRGACFATAVVTDNVRPGVVVLPTGAWLDTSTSDGTDRSGNPNVLTLDIPASGYSQGCAANTCLVSLTRVGEPDELEAAVHPGPDRRPVEYRQ